MSRFARAYYGAAFGALLSLLVHPASRPYITGLFTSWGPSQVRASTPWIPDNLSTLPQPLSRKDLHTMALWMQAGAEAILRRRELPQQDFSKLVEVATVAAEEEQSNAFWLHMKAVLLEEQGRKEEAYQAWKQAAVREVWNDRQSSRLIGIREQIAGETGALQAWQLQTVYTLRSSAVVQTIVRYAKHLLQPCGLESKEDLEARRLTVMNSQVMRDGARSMEAGIMAANLMEAASYPKGMTVVTNQKKLVLAREDFYQALKRAGMDEEADEVHRAYRKNDAWAALTGHDTAQSELTALTISSLAAAVFPGIALALAIFGALLWVLGIATQRSPRLQQALQPPAAPVIGVVVAIAIYMLTELPLAAITGVLCFAFLVFTPNQERSRTPQDLGPLFGFTMFVVGLALFLSIGAFLVGVSTPGTHTLSWLDVPREYYNGSTLFLGLSGILLGLMLLAAPTWALLEHIPTPTVVAMALKNLGSGLCAVCLGLAVVSAPLAVYADRQAADTLQKMVENEPTYYLTRS